MNPLTIKFQEHDDPFLHILRNEARAEGWTRVAGFREYAKQRYNAKLNISKVYGHITSITFKDEKEFIMFRLRG